MRRRFHSRLQAAQMAVKSWVCQNCDHSHTRKPKNCEVCSSGDLLYFASRGEARRYAQLALLRNFKQITELRVQVPYPVYFDGEVISKEKLGKPVFTYRADFVYIQDGEKIVEDSKGSEVGAMDTFKLKRKVIELLYGIQIKVTT